MSSKLAWVVTALAVIALAICWRQRPLRVAFPDLAGSQEASDLPAEPVRTGIEAYTTGGTHSMAILLRDLDSSWQGLALGLKSIGVPFRIVTDVETALTHDVVLVYPSLSGANTDSALAGRLTRHVEGGGTLLGFSVVGRSMGALFGYGESKEHSVRRQMLIQPMALTRGVIGDDATYAVLLGDSASATSGLPGTHYTGLEEPPVAIFADGTAAITQKSHAAAQEVGHAYAFGLDIGHYIQRAYNGRFPRVSNTYVNEYQPHVDNLLRLLAEIYRQGEVDAVLLSPTPHGRDFTALITFDVDFTESIENIAAYVDVVMRFDVPATFFVQTKYIKDFNDKAFFDLSLVPTLELLHESGMEIASHSVAHSNEFQRMLPGTGREQYPSYRPFVRDFSTVQEATLMGELRVSKYLLESLVGAEVVSFRPGHLSLPAALPQLLVATGYRYSSSITANEALTHLPYRLMHDREYSSQVDAFEFPVTIEDEAGRLGDRFGEAVALSNRIARYNGLVNILIHPDVVGHKMDFVRRYMESFQHRAWFASLRGFGDWWRVRDSVVTDVRRESQSRRRLIIEADGALTGLTLSVPARWQYLSGLEGTLQADGKVVLGEFADRAELVFQVVQ